VSGTASCACHVRELCSLARSSRLSSRTASSSSPTLRSSSVSWNVDLVDGTYLAFDPQVNGRRLEGWLRRLHSQPPLS